MSTASHKLLTHPHPNPPDPETANPLAVNCQDAARVLLMECDQQECAMVEGWNESDGWHFANTLEEGRHSKSEILMMSIDDDE